MDFRICPACQASVLEDDAVDCPFCGASMTTGKPAAGAKAPPKTSPAAAGGSAAAPTSPRPKAAPAPKQVQTESTDPFEVDTSAARKAIPVKPRPAKGYMIRVTCPMCERPGFISPHEVGKEVRCCNPDCLVPVFVASPPPEAAPPPQPVEKGGQRLWLLGGVGVLVIAVGVAAAFLIRRKPPEGTGPIDLGQLRPTPTVNGAVPPPAPGEQPQPQGPAPLTPQEVIARSLEGLRAAAQRAQNQRERALATRLLAEALIRSGNVAQAREELRSLTGTVRYLAIPPLALEAWRQIDAGQEAAAQKTLESALELQSSLPRQGRDALDAVSLLASALVAVGRVEEARALVEQHNDPLLGQLSAVWRAAVDGGVFRLDLLSRRACFHDLPHPQWASVTQVLAGHRRDEAAQAWALAAPDVAARHNCCAILASQWATHLSGADLDNRLTALAEGLEPVGRTRLWCAAGQAVLDRGDLERARALAGKARESLQGVPPPSAVPVPEMAPLYELADAAERGLPDPVPHRSAALAAMDLFALESQLGTEGAFAHVGRALEFSRGMGPGVPQTGALVREIEESFAATRRRFAQVLMIDDSVASARFSRYQTQVKVWHERAQERLAFETRLLTRAALAGHAAQVWALMQSAESAAEPAARQSYRDSTLPGLLLELARVDGASSLGQEVAKAFPQGPPPLSATDRVLVMLRADPTLQDWEKLRSRLQEYFERREPDYYRVNVAVLGAVLARLESDPPAAMRLAVALPDPLLSEDALWLVAARGTLLGKARTLQEGFVAREFASTAAMALYRGFLDGAAVPGVGEQH